MPAATTAKPDGGPSHASGPCPQLLTFPPCCHFGKRGEDPGQKVVSEREGCSSQSECREGDADFDGRTTQHPDGEWSDQKQRLRGCGRQDKPGEQAPVIEGALRIFVQFLAVDVDATEWPPCEHDQRTKDQTESEPGGGGPYQRHSGGDNQTNKGGTARGHAIGTEPSPTRQMAAGNCKQEVDANGQRREDDKSAVAVEVMIGPEEGEQSGHRHRRTNQPICPCREAGSGPIDRESSHDQLLDRQQDHDERQEVDGEEHRDG